MVGLLDYFQPRWNLGLLGLPMGNQSVGETPPAGLLNVSTMLYSHTPNYCGCRLWIQIGGFRACKAMSEIYYL